MSQKELKSLIKERKKVLKDFGLSNKVIEDYFKSQNIQTAYQLDLAANRLLARFFAAVDTCEAAENLKAATI